MKKNTRLLSIIILLFIGTVLVIFGTIEAFYQSRYPGKHLIMDNSIALVLLSIGCSIIAAVLVEYLNWVFNKKELIDELTNNFGQLIKSGEEWGLTRILQGIWEDFYKTIESSNEIKYVAFNASSILNPLPSKYHYFKNFLKKGGKITIIVLKPNSEAFNVRKSDWEEKSEVFESEMLQVKVGLIKILKDVKNNLKDFKNFNIIIRASNKIMYGNLIIFDNMLYHYTLNSSSWKIEDGFSLQARPKTKLGELFEVHFRTTLDSSTNDIFGMKELLNGKEFQIQKNNISSMIELLESTLP